MKKPLRIVVLVLYAAVQLHAAAAALAQSGTIQWSEPQRVWGYEDRAVPPFLVTGPDGIVHVMNSRFVSEEFGAGVDITYRRWSIDQGWSEPIDVILSPERDLARLRGLAMDGEGILHLVFFGGQDESGSIYYSSAPAGSADRAPAWSPPFLIADDAGFLTDAALATDGEDRLFVVFTGQQDGLGAYSTYSLDGGLSWSEPFRFHLSIEGQAPSSYALLVDQHGWLHVAWSEADLRSGNGRTLYYARLDANQSQWTQPTVIAAAEGEDFEVDTPALFEYDDHLIMMYFSDRPTTRFMRQSYDNGRTWSEPRQPFPQVGSNGPAAFIVDSAGRLHLFFGGRVGSPTHHGMWHSLYADGNVTLPVPVVSGPQIIDEIGGRGFDPGWARAALVRGNTILLTWATDGFAGDNGIHFTTATLDTPEVRPAAPVMVELQQTLPSSVPATATPAPNPAPEAFPERDGSAAPAAANGPVSPLLWGIIPVLALAGLIVVGQSVRRRY